MSVPQSLIGIHWVFAGFPTLGPHCPPTIEAYSHDTISAQFVWTPWNRIEHFKSWIAEQNKQTEAIWIPTWANCTFRKFSDRKYSSQVNRSYSLFRRGSEKLPLACARGVPFEQRPFDLPRWVEGPLLAGYPGVKLYIKIDGGDRSFRGLKFVVWYLSKVWRYLLASFRVLSENI